MSKPAWDAGYVPAASVKELLNYFEREIQKHHPCKRAVHSRRLGNSSRAGQSRTKPCCQEPRVPSSQRQLPCSVQAWPRATGSISVCSVRSSGGSSCTEASAQAYARKPPSSDQTSVGKFHSSGTPRKVTRVAKRSITPVREPVCPGVGAPVSSRLSPQLADEGLWLPSNKVIRFKPEPLRAPSLSREGLQSPGLSLRLADEGQRHPSSKVARFKSEPLRASSPSRDGLQSPREPLPGLSPRLADERQRHPSNKVTRLKSEPLRASSPSREGLQSPREPLSGLSPRSASREGVQSPRTPLPELSPRLADNGQWHLSNVVMDLKSEPRRAPSASREGLRSPYAPLPFDISRSPASTIRGGSLNLDRMASGTPRSHSSNARSGRAFSRVNSCATIVQDMRAAQNPFKATELALSSLAAPTCKNGAWDSTLRAETRKLPDPQTAMSSTSPRNRQVTDARWRGSSGQRSSSSSACVVAIEPTTHRSPIHTLIWEPPKKHGLCPERRICYKASSAPAGGEMMVK